MGDPDSQSPHRSATPDSILNFTWSFVCELHPHLARRARPGIDASLETKFVLDSLTRMELLVRLERHYQIRLQEHQLNQAETAGDLVRAVLLASHGTESVAELQVTEHEGLDSNQKPEQARTLLEVLDWHAKHHPERVHLHYYDDDEIQTPLTFGELKSGAQNIARALHAQGLNAGESVAMMLPSDIDYFYCFLGILMCGATPVPIYPPMRASQVEDHVRRQAKILDNARVTLLISFDEVKAVAALLRAQVETVRSVVAVCDLVAPDSPVSEAKVEPNDIAFIQYTSGSTGNPKGVVLTHQNILANIRAMDRALETSTADVFVSWLPLYHDMGLIGAWMGSLYVGFTLVLMSPLNFLSRPARWLRIIHQHRGTISGGPNFSYELCLQRIDDDQIEGLDLSCWRTAFNGAEPVSADTMRRFHQRFKNYGFSESALAPVYGLAEATLGLGFPPPGRGLHSDKLDRETLALQARAQPAAADDPNPLEVVACGQPMPGYEARIVDDSGRELPDRHQGRLEFKGPSTTSGYYRNPQATSKLFDGEWLDSGDLAYIADGDIFITSREKDMIIRGGRNIYPYELEDAVGDLDGIRKGCVAVFASRDERTQTERLVVVAETRETDTRTREQLQTQIAELAVATLGQPVDDIVLSMPRTVRKTSSGKIRRSATGELYDAGRLNPHGTTVTLQVVRLAAAGVLPTLRRMRRRVVEHIRAGWSWLVVVVLTLLCFAGVCLIPGLENRWSIIRRLGAGALRLIGLRVLIEGAQHIPLRASFVLVCNHQSYLDGPLLAICLPRAISYVAKSELSNAPFFGLFLSRLGIAFVDRFDRERSLEDARAVQSRLEGGTPIGYFPEGTFRRMPGLLPFHMGAFLTAAQTGTPIVPVVLRGTRSVLRDQSWFPRSGQIRLIVGEPIEVALANGDESSQFAEAVRLRDRARAFMLANCGEPDLIEVTVERPGATAS